jgi:hypothetical protein
MFQQVANALNLPLRPHDTVMNTLLQRIIDQLPIGMKPEDEGFSSACFEAEKAVDAEGDMAIVSLVRSLTAVPTPKEDIPPKIKITLKGKRILTPAPNGIRYSFGPVWMSAVMKCEGIALMSNYRDKLNHQAFLAGIEGAEQMNASELCALVAKSIEEENNE